MRNATGGCPSSRRPRTVLVAALLGLVVCAGCRLPLRPALPEGGASLERQLVLNGHRLRLHMHQPGTAAARPLLVYATGDGGWAGKDLGAYRALAGSGDPVVGFDAHDYVRNLGAGLASTTTPARLAHDYQAIIAAAEEAMHLPAGGPVVLVGVSRGAGLSVVAAGAASLRPTLHGVLAVALTREEEYARWRKPIRPMARRRVPVMIQLYDYLPRLGSLPIAVIQSTNDDYLPAAAARALFGPDTPSHRLVAIQARNHSFAGARDKMYDAMAEALEWIDARGSAF
ncbi:MAG: alpha/beta hydrolase [Acidobacteriota bacterium]